MPVLQGKQRDAPLDHLGPGHRDFIRM